MSKEVISKGGAPQEKPTAEPPIWYEDPVTVVALAALTILGMVLILGVAKQLEESRVAKRAAGVLLGCLAIQVLRGMGEDAPCIIPPEEVERAEQVKWACDQLEQHIEQVTLFADGSFYVKFKIEDEKPRKKLTTGMATIRISPELKGKIIAEEESMIITEGWMQVAPIKGVFTSVKGISLMGNRIVLNNTFAWVPYQWLLYELVQNEDTPQHILCEGCRKELDDFVVV